MALVRDVQPPEQRPRALDLRALLRRVLPTPRRPHVPHRQITPGVLDVRPAPAGNVLSTLGRWLRQRFGLWHPRTTLPQRRTIASRSIPATFEVQDVAPRFARVRPYLPFALSLAALTFTVLIGTVIIRLSAVERVARDQAVFALEESQLGLSALLSADSVAATTHFATAREQLADTANLLQKLSAESALAPLSPAENSIALLRAATAAADAGQDFAQAMTGVTAKDTRAILLGTRDGIAKLHEAADTLRGTEALLPSNAQSRVLEAQRQIDGMLARLAPIEVALPTLMAAAGEHEPKRYLLVFQNTAERRGTGGFMGSVARVEFNDLRMTSFDFRDIYSIDWAQRDAPPAPFGLARYFRTVHMRDANYSPDFPTAAAWIERHYERSGGTTLDGVIAIDSQVFFNFLEALGPINLPGTKTPMTRDHAFDLLTIRIETSKKNPDGPKSVLKDLLDTMLQRAQERQRWDALSAVARAALTDGHIQGFAKDPKLEDGFRRLGIDGALPAPDPAIDELLLTSTNVGGNKSDRFVHIQASHNVTLHRDGSASGHVSIRKSFTLPKDFDARLLSLTAAFDTKTQSYLRHVLGDSTNKDYLRVFLPLGTKVRDVAGLRTEDWDVHEEIGRTVVGLHIWTQPGDIREVQINVDYPFRLDPTMSATYRFRSWKVPGTEAMDLRHRVVVDAGLTLVGTPDPSSVDVTFHEGVKATHAVVVTAQ